MGWLLLLAVLLALVYGPQLWVRWVMRRHGRERPELPGTGGELARHLVRRFALDGVSVEETDQGDHFDPQARAVRLSPDNYGGKSLTAVAVAAHEVGHALQCCRNERIFRLRERWIPVATTLGRVGVGVFMVLPLVALVLRSPAALGSLLACGLVLQLAGAAVYLLVLPEELDASFNKALPILVEGDYVQPDEVPAVRSVLRAAAWTYFAAALAGVLNLARWWWLLVRSIR